MTNHGLTDRQLAIIKQTLAPYADRIKRVSLFGSRAAGTHRANSDIDLVLHGNLNEVETTRLETLFKESSLPVSVDVKHYNSLTYAPLKRHIDQVEQVLFTGRELFSSQNHL